jgi:TonB family protein
MKRISLLMILSILSTSIYSQKDLKKTTLEDKNAKTKEVYYLTDSNLKSGSYSFAFKKHTQIKGQYINDLKTGVWEYTPDKKFRISGKYENNLKEGRWVYLKNNDTITILNYEKGVKVGKQIGYFDNKQIAYEAIFNGNGKIEGEEKLYFENGKLATVRNHKNGELHGDKIAYTDKGDLVYKLTYANNSPVNLTIAVTDTSYTDYSGNLTNGTGTLKSIKSKDGTIMLERNFRDSLLHGEIIGYNLDGKIRFKGSYENGYMVGVWEFFNPYEGTKREKEYSLHDKLKFDENESATRNFENVTVVIGEMPTMVSSDNNFRKFIGENLVYPRIAASRGREGRVFVSFVINEVGEVENARVEKGVEPSLDAEALRVVNSSPLWRPGLKSRMPTRVSFNFPIIFVLQ